MGADINNYLGLLQNDIREVTEITNYYIYALWKDGEIVYIGQTVQLEVRLLAHTKDKDFDKYSYFKCRNRPQMESVETYLIDTLKPEYNKIIGDGYINIKTIRARIQGLAEEYKYDPRYYVGNLKERIEELGIELIYHNSNWSIHVRDLEKAMDNILGDENIDK